MGSRSKCGGRRRPRKHQETADNYAEVVVRLNDRWRVVVCKDNSQWILQCRDGTRSGRRRWKGVQYCRTRKALIRVSREFCGPLDPDAMAVLEHLSEHFGRKS